MHWTVTPAQNLVDQVPNPWAAAGSTELREDDNALVVRLSALANASSAAVLLAGRAPRAIQALLVSPARPHCAARSNPATYVPANHDPITPGGRLPPARRHFVAGVALPRRPNVLPVLTCSTDAFGTR